MLASMSRPPSLSAFSYRVTVWPRFTSVCAAIIPAGPPPMTMTRLRWDSGSRSISPAMPQRGLMAQLMAVP